MGTCIYIWNVAIESEVADTIGSTARVTRKQFHYQALPSQNRCMIWFLSLKLLQQGSSGSQNDTLEKGNIISGSAAEALQTLQILYHLRLT